MIREMFSSSQDLANYLACSPRRRFALSFFPESPPFGETIYFSDDRRELIEKAIGFAEKDIHLVQVAPRQWSAINLDYPLPRFFAPSLTEAYKYFWEVMVEAVRGQGFEALLFEEEGFSLENYLKEWQVLESIRLRTADCYH